MLENQKPSTPVLIEDLGRLYATEKSTKKEHFGIYKCSCGNTFKAQIRNVKNSNTTSCGCYKKRRVSESKITHGMSKHHLYKTWTGMIHRTTNIKNPKFLHYGGRGIKVCERWLSFENFIKDVYSTYSKGLSIDRIDVNGNYEPSNCRWTTIEIQNRNTQLIQSNNKSGYRGVCFCKQNKKWVSGIRINSKSKHLGYFNTAIEAARAYDAYVIDNNLEHTINGA